VIVTYINNPEYWEAVLVALMVIALRINPTNGSVLSQDT
jgi:hypothetical protein